MSSIRTFKIFMAVVETGSFSGAAEKIGLTPAAVSQQMRLFEAALNQTLFDRHGKSIRLNERGHYLHDHVRRMLSIYDNMRQFSGPSEDIEGEISVGTIATCMNVLARTIVRLHEKHPGLRIRPFIGFSGDLPDRVRAGELDAAITVKGERGGPVDLRWTVLHREPLVFVANRHSSQGAPVHELVSRMLFLRMMGSNQTGLLIQRLVAREKWRIHDSLELNSLRTLVELVQQDVGVTVVPLPCGAAWQHAPELDIRHFDAAHAVRLIGLAESARQPYLTAILRQGLQATMAEYADGAVSRPGSA